MPFKSATNNPREDAGSPHAQIAAFRKTLQNVVTPTAPKPPMEPTLDSLKLDNLWLRSELQKKDKAIAALKARLREEVNKSRAYEFSPDAREVPAALPSEKRIRLLCIFDQRCFYCAGPLTLETMTQDHVVPRMLGGSNGISNLAACCFGCNQAKGNRAPTPAELSRLAFFHRKHGKKEKKRAKYRPEPLTVFPLADIRLGPDGRVICPARAHGSS